MLLRLITENEKGNGHIMQVGTMNDNDEYLGSYFYSSFFIRHF